jgi:hypothetical protein
MTIQWAVTTELQVGDVWEHSETRYFRTRESALRGVAEGIRGALRARHEALVDGERTLLGRVSCPWGTCPACGCTDLYDSDVHEVTARGCRSWHEPLVGRLVRVTTLDGVHVGRYGRIAYRDGYTVLHAKLHGGPQIAVGDQEFELVLPRFEAEGVTYHRVGQHWGPDGRPVESLIEG